MLVADVEREIGRIAALASDPESAHGAEDALYADVLRAIADGADNAADLAKAALKAADLEFERWYA